MHQYHADILSLSEELLFSFRVCNTNSELIISYIFNIYHSIASSFEGSKIRRMSEFSQLSYYSSILCLQNNDFHILDQRRTEHLQQLLPKDKLSPERWMPFAEYEQAYSSPSIWDQ